ncbi:MAG: hypothetical protein FJ117_01665 [Deltaproteobacteria bacterium]|nr:hypothetical protein [Deltaproteobacteria bacterium]
MPFSVIPAPYQVRGKLQPESSPVQSGIQILINTLDSGFHLSARHRQAGLTTFYETIKFTTEAKIMLLVAAMPQCVGCG